MSANAEAVDAALLSSPGRPNARDYLPRLEALITAARVTAPVRSRLIEDPDQA